MYEEISNSNKAIIFFFVFITYTFAFYWLSKLWRSPEKGKEKLKNKKYIVEPSGKGGIGI